MKKHLTSLKSFLKKEQKSSQMSLFENVDTASVLKKITAFFSKANTSLQPALDELSTKLHQKTTSILSEYPKLHELAINFKGSFPLHPKKYAVAAILDVVFVLLIAFSTIRPVTYVVNNLVSPITPLQSLTEDQSKGGYEVFGFAPFWTFDNLDNVDFKVLTTLSYFGVEVDSDGTLIKDDQGYRTFKSSEATALFKKAHANGTRVVLTLTQMNNAQIRAIMDSEEAQERTINQAVAEVKNRGIDGINIDFEYMGDPGDEYRNKFTKFVSRMTEEMHKEVPSSKVTVSVYASAVKDPKIYDIGAIADNSDGIFMMAYDFAVARSENAIPTAPLYGHKEGKYWYDISTAVDDFLTQMPADKLILGVPYYGYNYMVTNPTVKATTRSYSWRGSNHAQTYTRALEDITEDNPNITNIQTGWDDAGKVGYKAYYVPSANTWRMVFIEDGKSLGIKYDFAKEKNLGGVGMWALGFDEGKSDLWTVLADKFGAKSSADMSIVQKEIK